MKQHTYIAIDLKSFYASVECRERGLDPLDTNLVVADESRTDTIGIPTRSFTFWNGGNTQDAPSISRPIPILFGIRNRGKRPLKSRQFSTIPTRRSLSRRSLTRCRKFASSVTAGQRRARAVCFLVWSTALIVEQKCATAPPTTLKSGRIILYAPTTAAIREVVRHTLSVLLFWKNWSGCT